MAASNATLGIAATVALHEATETTLAVVPGCECCSSCGLRCFAGYCATCGTMVCSICSIQCGIRYCGNRSTVLDRAARTGELMNKTWHCTVLNHEEISFQNCKLGRAIVVNATLCMSDGVTLRHQLHTPHTPSCSSGPSSRNLPKARWAWGKYGQEQNQNLKIMKTLNVKQKKNQNNIKKTLKGNGIILNKYKMDFKHGSYHRGHNTLLK